VPANDTLTEALLYTSVSLLLSSDVWYMRYMMIMLRLLHVASLSMTYLITVRLIETKSFLLAILLRLYR
jgi:hypothetical protein